MIYITGPIDENNKEDTKERFAQAEEYLKHEVFAYEDHGVFNTYTQFFEKKKYKDIKSELMARFRAINSCDKLYFLVGWEKDQVARVEHEFAKVIGMRVIYSKKF